MIARERFELSSAGPEPAMLGRYTTGLIFEINLALLKFSSRKLIITTIEYFLYDSILKNTELLIPLR